MKANKLLLTVLLPLLLSGCKNGITIKSEVNYDEDPTEDVTNDVGDNDFDDHEVTDENVETPETYDTFTDNKITAAGKYYLKGEYPSLAIETTKKNTEIYIFLDGVTIDCNTGIAFGSTSESKTTILHLVLLNNSTNSITNDFIDTNAFHVKGQVYLSGSGTLNVESKQKSGFKVSKDFYIYEGVTLNATGATHAIAAQSITSKGATINVTTPKDGKDGIQLECDDETTIFTTEEGFAYLLDTKFTSNTYGDGIQADTYVYISGGEYNITTHGEFVSYSSTNKETYNLTNDDFKYVKSNGSYKRVATDEIHSLSSSYYALTNSVKGIKAGVIEYDSNDDDEDDTAATDGDYQIYIAHLAKLTINTTDDCIHANYGKVNIDSSNLTLDTIDDGVHADYNLNINNASIEITNSYEGLEGANVVIDGADTNIISNSQDDGINAASDLVSETNITINDGYLRVFASGDGLDANNALYLNGGKVIVEGPGSGNGSLDSEQIYFNGGIVMAFSTSGMTEKMTAKQYTFAWQGSTISKDTKVSIVDSSSNAIFSYTLKQSANQIIFSHPDLKSGQTYKIVSGSTSLASITMSSTLVTSGINQGGGGHGGPGWH